jgi:hypothetical protein
MKFIYSLLIVLCLSSAVHAKTISCGLGEECLLPVADDKLSYAVMGYDVVAYRCSLKAKNQQPATALLQGRGYEFYPQLLMVNGMNEESSVLIKGKIGFLVGSIDVYQVNSTNKQATMRCCDIIADRECHIHSV